MSEETPIVAETPVKRRPGRPKKIVAEREAQREAPREPQQKVWNMRARPNWETMDPQAEETPDRYRIRPELIPDGMSLQWVTDSVFGQGVPHHRAEFERGGWTPVHQEDFDGRYQGMFMSRGKEGEINVDGQVLMARPAELTRKAAFKNSKKAIEQVMIKEQALRGGDIPVSLDPTHPSAVRTNRISKSMERVAIPED